MGDRAVAWRYKAACRGLDPNMFFPKDNDFDTEDAARAVCASCPVRQDCLEDALQSRSDWDQVGIRGGTSGRERRNLRRNRNNATAV